MKLLGIVILYYPDDAVVKNIATYLAQLDELMLWIILRQQIAGIWIWILWETGEGKSFWMVAVKIWALVLR